MWILEYENINKLVKPDQTDFIINQQGVDNVRKALNLQEIITKNDTPSLLLSLDAEKAFDRVERLGLGMGARGVRVRNWCEVRFKKVKRSVKERECGSLSMQVVSGPCPGVASDMLVAQWHMCGRVSVSRPEGKFGVRIKMVSDY